MGKIEKRPSGKKHPLMQHEDTVCDSIGGLNVAALIFSQGPIAKAQVHVVNHKYKAPVLKVLVPGFFIAMQMPIRGP